MDNKLTKKKVILIKLKNLQDKLKVYCKEDESIFPDVMTIDVADFLFYFNFLFPLGSDYNKILKDFIIERDILINIEDINEVINIVSPFIVFLKKI